MLSALFGGSEHTISQTMGTETGLPTGVASTLMTMVAPMVMGYFTRRLRGDGMTMGGLGSLLEREMPAIKAALPASLVALIWPRERVAAAVNPVIHQTTTVEKSGGRWVLPLILLALIPGLLWLFTHARRPTVVVIPRPPVSTGTANRAMPETTPTTKVVIHHA
jgi:hypothetical protein